MSEYGSACFALVNTNNRRTSYCQKLCLSNFTHLFSLLILTHEVTSNMSSELVFVLKILINCFTLIHPNTTFSQLTGL